MTTRDPASAKRIGTETLGFMMPAGVIAAHYAKQFDPSMPDMIQNSIAGIFVGIGSMLLSKWRDRKSG